MIRYIILFSLFFLLTGVGISPDADTQSSAGNKSRKLPFETLEIEAESAVVLDLNNMEIVFEKNADIRRPLASLTKLVSASVFYEQAPPIFEEGELAIPIALEGLLQDGDDGFAVGELYDARSLLGAALVKSSNDAARSLSIWLQKHEGEKEDSLWFVNEMNLFVGSLGLKETYFLNTTGLDEGENISGGYSTARETAILFSELIREKRGIIGITTKHELEISSSAGKKLIFKSTAGPILGIPGLIAVKTGYTDLAGGNLAWSFGAGPGHQYVAVVMGSTYEGRFSDALKIYEAVLEYIQGVSR